ncbi:acyl-CoA thioesterase [Novosphingobium sp. NBM11]|uniref:acyl-CoA thioesterase n=1 Tax=Novosphingobium sp. NBM11 TaxID=2596914 RepID=UPI00189251F4|nr:thioesterase family protein [Novosphingobium sp. NBM11]MBF5090475.1 acyl-CoA thioesterase [Novosphingobium sp. NBM11]
MAKPDPALLDAARYPFDLEITTRFADLDPNDHINNVAIAAVLEDARVRFNEALGFRTVIRPLRAMVASVSIDYLAQGHYPQPLRCHVGAVAIGRTSWTVQQLLVQGDAAVATARTVIVCVDGDRPHPLPDAARAAIDQWMLRA